MSAEIVVIAILTLLSAGLAIWAIRLTGKLADADVENHLLHGIVDSQRGQQEIERQRLEAVIKLYKDQAELKLANETAEQTLARLHDLSQVKKL